MIPNNTESDYLNPTKWSCEKPQLYIVVETHRENQGGMGSARTVVKYCLGRPELDAHLKLNNARLSQMRIFKAEEMKAQIELTLKVI